MIIIILNKIIGKPESQRMLVKLLYACKIYQNIQTTSECFFSLHLTSRNIQPEARPRGRSLTTILTKIIMTY